VIAYADWTLRRIIRPFLLDESHHVVIALYNHLLVLSVYVTIHILCKAFTDPLLVLQNVPTFSLSPSLSLPSRPRRTFRPLIPRFACAFHFFRARRAAVARFPVRLAVPRSPAVYSTCVQARFIFAHRRNQ